MNRGDVREANKIGRVERQETANRVDRHDGHQASIVNLHAQNFVHADDLFLRGINLWNIGQQGE